MINIYTRGDVVSKRGRGRNGEERGGEERGGGALGRCGSGRVRRGDAVALRRIWHGIDLGHEWCAGSP